MDYLNAWLKKWSVEIFSNACKRKVTRWSIFKRVQKKVTLWSIFNAWFIKSSVLGYGTNWLPLLSDLNSRIKKKKQYKTPNNKTDTILRSFFWFCHYPGTRVQTVSNGPVTWPVSVNQIALLQKLIIHRIIKDISTRNNNNIYS